MDDKCLLPEIVRPGLDLIVVGAAPSVQAALTGHYYAGGRNRFWRLLFESGFTPRELNADEDHTVLDYGIGLTGILRNEISVVNSLLPPPSDDQKRRLHAMLVRCAPHFICYNGKDVWRMVNGEEDCAWGLQMGCLGTSQQYVVHSSSGRADRWGADRLFLWRELKRLVDEAGDSRIAHRT